MDIYVAEGQNALSTTEGQNAHKIVFEGQEKDEKIVLFLRQHPIINIPWIATSLLMFTVPTILTYLKLLEFLPTNFLFIGVLSWYLITSGFALEKLLSWLFNVYIVTDKRIIDIDFFNLIHKQISYAALDKIQDITHSTGGVMGTLFNWGDVLMQTAGASPNFDFLKVPQPQQVVEKIKELQNGSTRSR